MARIEEIELTVLDKAIFWPGWVRRIVRELGGLPGVEKVTADHKTQVVRLTLDVEKMSPDEARKQLERAGFPAR